MYWPIGLEKYWRISLPIHYIPWRSYALCSGEVANSKRSNTHLSDELLDPPNVSITRYLLPWWWLQSAFVISIDMAVSTCHWCTQRSIETVRYCSYREVGLLWYNLSVNHHQLWMNSPVQGRCTWTEQSPHYENCRNKLTASFISKWISTVSKTDCWARFTIFKWHCYVRWRAYNKVI